jgi:hypothetical protein
MKEIGNAGARNAAGTSTIALKTPIFRFGDERGRCHGSGACEVFRKFASIHSSVYNHFNHQRNIESRARFKSLRDAALLEWRELLAA